MFISRTHPIYQKLTARLLGLLLLFTASAVSGQTPAPAAGQPAAAPGGAQADRSRRETGQASRRANRKGHKGRSLGRGNCAGRGIARLAEPGPGPEAFRDRDHGLASSDIAPGGPDGEGGSSRVPISPTLNEQAETLFAQGKYTAAQPLFEGRSQSAGGCLATTTPTPPCATPT